MVQILFRTRITTNSRRIVAILILAFTFLRLYTLRYRDLVQHLYTNFSCPTPRYITSPITQIRTNGTASDPLALHAPNHVVRQDDSLSAFAYVFYATDSFYACSVLVNVDRLNNLFSTTHRIIVLVKPDLDAYYLTAFTARNATVIPYEPPPLATDSAIYYRHVLLKLVAFRLHHYVPSLKRILVLDGDQIILQSLDHIFNLPAVDIASPRAYWLDGNGITTAFLLISLSDRLWNKMSASLKTIGSDVYDMDLVNQLFKKTILVLPGDYATLNTHWEVNDIPNWWQGTVPDEVDHWQLQATRTQELSQIEEPPPLERPPTQEPAQFEEPPPPQQPRPQQPSQFQEPPPPNPPPPQQRPQTSETNRIRDPTPINHAKLPSPALNARDSSTTIEMEEQEELLQKQKIYHRVLRQVYADVKVLHFTALGKPWSWPAPTIASKRPYAHQLFKHQFSIWQNAASTLCPAAA